MPLLRPLETQCLFPPLLPLSSCSYTLAPPRFALPLHLVRPVAVAQAEGAAEVREQVGLVLKVRNQRLVDGFLVLHASAGRLLLLRGRSG